MSKQDFELIDSQEKLMRVIQQLHEASNRLVDSSLGFLPNNAGNLGIFCHFESEYNYLMSLQNQLVHPSTNPATKYFKLIDPIVISKTSQYPMATYTHIYIRKPDPTPYGQNLGDIDYYVESEKFYDLIELVKAGTIPTAELYDQVGVGPMIQLTTPASRVLTYISTKEITEKVRFRH